MERAHREFEARGVKFLGIFVKDTEADARRFLAETRITFPSGLDPDGRIAWSYRLLGMPLTVFLAPDGRIVERVTGPLGEEDLVERVRGLL